MTQKSQLEIEQKYGMNLRQTMDAISFLVHIGHESEYEEDTDFDGEFDYQIDSVCEGLLADIRSLKERNQKIREENRKKTEKELADDKMPTEQDKIEQKYGINLSSTMEGIAHVMRLASPHILNEDEFTDIVLQNMEIISTELRNDIYSMQEYL